MPKAALTEIDLRILDPRIADRMPHYATPGSAGLDLRACIDAPLQLDPGAAAMIPTGIAIHIAHPGLAALVLPRSDLQHPAAGLRPVWPHRPGPIELRRDHARLFRHVGRHVQTIV